MFASLLPKSAPFFEMLLEQNSHLRHMSRLLLAMLEDLSKMDEAHKEIALIEEEADKLHVRIIRDLSQTFITPIDREDILRINPSAHLRVPHHALPRRAAGAHHLLHAGADRRDAGRPDPA